MGEQTAGGEKQERDVSELMGLVIIPDDISRLDRISFNRMTFYIWRGNISSALTGKRNQSPSAQKEKDISQQGGCARLVAMVTYKTSPRS